MHPNQAARWTNDGDGDVIWCIHESPCIRTEFEIHNIYDPCSLSQFPLLLGIGRCRLDRTKTIPIEILKHSREVASLPLSKQAIILPREPNYETIPATSSSCRTPEIFIIYRSSSPSQDPNTFNNFCDNIPYSPTAAASVVSCLPAAVPLKFHDDGTSTHRVSSQWKALSTFIIVADRTLF